MAPMKATNRRMSVRHPAGTNHFQLRDHQFGCGGIPGCGAYIGGVAMLGSSRRNQDEARAAPFLASSMSRTVRANTSEENGFCRKAVPGISCCSILSSVYPEM